MNKTIKRLLKALAGIVGAVVLLVLGYVIYMSSVYYRIDDFQKLEAKNPTDDILDVGEEYSAITYNIGFGAYTHDFSFFMDSGVMNDGTPVTGKNSVAFDVDTVIKNTNGSINVSKDEDADFYLFQEVDTDSTRSHGINQEEMISNAFSDDYSSVFASAFHTGYMFYPFHEPHGIANSGLLTLAKYKADEHIRRQYPIDESMITKFFDLDRCFIMSRFPVNNGKELIVINSHMSAYDKGGLVREKQLELLNSVIAEEYEKGNYVIVGGDFNHDIAGMAGKFKSEQKTPEWVYVLNDENLTKGFNIVIAENKENVPTCRSTDIPYKRGVNYTSILDGFIVSDNIEAFAHNIDTDFEYSDHNPVSLTFKLK